MRTSLNEIKLIDEHLFNSAAPQDALLFDALLIINPELNKKVTWQKKAHNIIQQYSRKHLKAEIEAVHQQLFNEPEHKSFREKILDLFN